MRFIRYDAVVPFQRAVHGVLMKDENSEAENNLIISIITNNAHLYAGSWLLSTVNGDSGGIELVAVCSPPFPLLLCGAGEGSDAADAAAFLAGELRHVYRKVGGVIAPPGLARSFAAAYVGEKEYSRRKTLSIMRLDSVNDITKAPGYARPLTGRDLTFAPKWEFDFRAECGVEQFGLNDLNRRIAERIGKDTHLLWIDGKPVSQAVCGRDTPSGAVISYVYTHPEYRGRGYASSAVAELCRGLLDRGNKFCALFADTENPVSRGMYRKIGFIDLCTVDELVFA